MQPFLLEVEGACPLEAWGGLQVRTALVKSLCVVVCIYASV
jgi:hypothetical protein